MDTTPVGTPRIGGLSPDAFSSLFQAIGGLRNRSALTAMFACLVTGIVLLALLSTMGGFGAMLGGLVYLIALWTGINAAGVLLMDQAKGVAPRAVVDALVYGLMCIPKVLVLSIAFFLVALAVFLVIALVYFVCKIPLLGAIVYAVALPLSVVIGGITIWGLFVCMFLSLPAIWEGASIMSAIAQSLAIVRSRLIETLLLMTFIWILSVIVAMIVFGVLGMGMVPAMSLSAMVFSGGGGGAYGGGMGGMGPLGGLMGGLAGGGAGVAIAGTIGMGVLFAAAGTLVALVYLLGLNLVYLRVTEGLDASATQQALQQKLDEAKRRASDMGQKAREAAERAREQARPAAPPAAPVAAPPAAAFEATTPAARMPPPAVALTCPACQARVTAEDVFCESCGHRLK